MGPGRISPQNCEKKLYAWEEGVIIINSAKTLPKGGVYYGDSVTAYQCDRS